MTQATAIDSPEALVRAEARQLSLSHWAVAATFVSFGVGSGLWSGSTGALLARTGIGAVAFGFTLTAYTAVYLAAMSLMSNVARQFGVKPVGLAAAILACPALAVVLMATQAWVLIAGLMVYAVAAGTLDSSMNAQGAALERRFGRPIFARLHGCASAGGAVGAILGSLLISGPWPWLSPVLGVLGFVGVASFVAAVVPGDLGGRLGAGAPVGVRLFSRALIVIGVVVGVSITCESATLAWSSTLLRGEAPKLAAIAGLGGTFFSLCQFTLRFNADRMRARYGDRNLIAVSLAVATLGLSVVALPFGFYVSALGFAIIGVGTGSIVPCGFALAATRPGVSASAGISAVAFVGMTARLPAPIVIGSVAQTYSLSAAFLLVAALMLFALVAVLLLIPDSPGSSGKAVP